MRKRKLKAYVIPTIYAMIVMVIFVSIMFMNNTLNANIKDEIIGEKEDYVIDIFDKEEIPVLSEIDNSVSKPYIDKDVEIEVNYYSKDDSSEKQEESLIYYNNTYMQNTGIVYSSDEVYEVVSVLDGTIKNISQVEILGTVIEIEHSNEYTSYYYSVADVVVSIGDKVTKGDVISSSGVSKLDNDGDYCLLFEIYYQGKTIDPNLFYELEIKNEQ